MGNLFRQEPAVIVGAVQALLALVAAFGLEWITPEQAAALVAFISAATLLIRSTVYAPATAEEIKAQRDLLAETVRTADETGSVSYKGAKTAKQVLGEGAATIISPALSAALVAAGLPANYAVLVGPKAAQMAVDAVNQARRRPLDRDESRDAIREIGSEL